MKEDIQRVVSQSIENIAKNIHIPDLPVVVEVGIPKRKDFGDFSVNTAMVIANKIGKKPREVAELIIENLPLEKEQLFKKIEIAACILKSLNPFSPTPVILHNKVIIVRL